MDKIDELASAFARLPGIGPRQGKRFVFHLLTTPKAEREKFAALIKDLSNEVRQCQECSLFFNGTTATICRYCSNTHRDDSLLMIIEKDQDLVAVERAGTYKGRYFVLGGVLTLSGKGTVRKKELINAVEKRLAQGLTEIVLALSATSEGEHTADYVRDILSPFRDHIKISILGRGLATGSELEYSDAATLSSALRHREET